MKKLKIDWSKYTPVGTMTVGYVQADGRIVVQEQPAFDIDPYLEAKKARNRRRSNARRRSARASQPRRKAA